MKLYLSSSRLEHPKSVAALLGQDSLEGVRAIVLVNAAAAHEAGYVHWRIGVELGGLGLQIERLDLRVFAHALEVERELSCHQLVWALDGDVWALREAMRVSGFDRAIGALLNRGGLVYGGSRAGAVVCGRRLGPADDAPRGLRLLEQTLVLGEAAEARGAVSAELAYLGPAEALVVDNRRQFVLGRAGSEEEAYTALYAQARALDAECSIGHRHAPLGHRGRSVS